jgi:D-galactarolactone isomerase
MADRSKPRLQVPPGACDCHMHIFDARFPPAAKARRREPAAPVSEYRKLQRALGLERVVVVQPTAYGTDNRCTLEAIASLGGNARGIAVIDDSISAAGIGRLHDAGMRGVRFRMLDDAVLLDLLLDWAPDDATRERILADNAAQLYGF